MHDFIRSLSFNGSQTPFAGSDRRSPESLRGIMRSFDEEPTAFRPAPHPAVRGRRRTKNLNAK